MNASKVDENNLQSMNSRSRQNLLEPEEESPYMVTGALNHKHMFLSSLLDESTHNRHSAAKPQLATLP